jgi:hypothetical protein
MNKKIKELADQAGLRSIYFEGESIQKFAELIVKECSKVIVNGGYWSGGPLGPKRQCTPPEIATMIKQHFGVEE